MPGQSQALLWLLLLLLLLLHSAIICTCSSSRSPQLPPSSSGAGGGVACAAADSLGRLIDFFARNAEGMEADGYFGLAIASLAVNTAPLRVAAGIAVRDDCGDSRLVELGRAMARLSRLLGDFRSRAAAGGGGGGSAAYDSVTYRKICRPMEVVVRRLLEPDAFRWRRLDDGGDDPSVVGGGGNGGNSTSGLDRLTARLGKLNSYDESTGDACFRSIFAIKGRRCPVSSKCRRLFLTSIPSFGYTLTHQFMYWTVAIDKSCHLTLSNGRPVDQSLLHDACRRAYAEHRDILGAGPAGLAFIDLALEQAVLCGIMGYRDFFSDTTTLLLRRLQNERLGCFDNLPAGASVDATASPDSADGANATGTGRKLLHDALLEGVCSSHTSGLAAAYFSLSLRI